MPPFMGLEEVVHRPPNRRKKRSLRETGKLSHVLWPRDFKHQRVTFNFYTTNGASRC